jgi:hypothetical protein
MDAHFQPINGISLERYADLGAAIADDMNDAAKVATILETEGVALADWEAAKKGWTARMQDMSLMGRVATAYMPLYQAALAKRKGGRASASYEDFVAVSAAIKVLGYEVALRACEVKSSDWTEVAGHWAGVMGHQMMQYAGHHDLVSREEARIRGGGTPRKITVTRESRPASPEATLPSAGAMPAAQPYAAANLNPMAAAMANPAYQQAMAAQQQVMQNPLGFGFAQVGAFLTGGVVPGSSVLVTHPSDGQRYPGRVLSTAPQQTLVLFPNGTQQWVPANAVQRA